MLSNKLSVLGTTRLIKTLVVSRVIKDSLNPLDFEVQCGHSPDEGCFGKCWLINVSCVTDLFLSTLLIKWLYRLTYASLGASILDVSCSRTKD